jgi:alanyl-tRNA synthetase
MYRLVPALVAEMGAAYPELVRAQPLIEATLQQEETRFRQTLANGLKLLDEATGADWRAGRHAARRDRVQALRHLRLPLRPDRGRAARPRARGRPRRLRRAMAEQKAAARAAWKGSGERRRTTLVRPRRGAWRDRVHRLFGRRRRGRGAGDRQGRRARRQRRGRATPSTVLLNQTPFYGESGGQIGDTGKLTRSRASKAKLRTRRSRSASSTRSHQGRAGELKVGDTVHQKSMPSAATASAPTTARPTCSTPRCATARRRTSRRRAAWSRPTGFRFDFSHPKALTREEIEAVEAEVNAQIRANEPVTTRLMTPDEAIAAGAMALFGEKYGDEVRVLSMGRDDDKHYSVELCGGTHVRALGDIQLLQDHLESAVSSGVRRIEALTGEAARQWLNERDEKLREAAATLKSSPDEVPARVAALVEDRRGSSASWPTRRRRWRWAAAAARPKARGPEQVGGHAFLGQVVEGLDPEKRAGSAKRQGAPCTPRRPSRASAPCARRRRASAAAREILGPRSAAAASVPCRRRRITSFGRTS